MRRKDREKSKDFAIDVVKKCEYGNVSMVDGNLPYSVIVSPAFLNGYIYFHSAKEGRKIDVLKSNNNVCFTCATGVCPVENKFTTFFQSAVVFGKCTEVNDETEKIEALKSICIKYSSNNMDEFNKAISASISRTAVFKISIDEITGKEKGPKK